MKHCWDHSQPPLTWTHKTAFHWTTRHITVSLRRHGRHRPFSNSDAIYTLHALLSHAPNCSVGLRELWTCIEHKVIAIRTVGSPFRLTAVLAETLQIKLLILIKLFYFKIIVKYKCGVHIHFEDYIWIFLGYVRSLAYKCCCVYTWCVQVLRSPKEAFAAAM